MPQRKGRKKNGLRLYPFLSPSLSLESDSSSSQGQRVSLPSKAKCPQTVNSKPPSTPSSASQSPCSWMRRSESTYAVNQRHRVRGQIRSATSLPHIPKAKAERARSSRKSPCLLVALRPVNVEEERERFFQSSFAYNPQFVYGEPIPETVLEKYRDASEQFLSQVKILLLFFISHTQPQLPTMAGCSRAIPPPALHHQV